MPDSRQPDSLSDEQLVELCNRGDGDEATAAFGVLYKRHRDFVLRVALRLTDDREIVADALHDVFAYLLKQFPPPGAGLTLTARLTTYLYPIAKNSTLSLLRKSKRLAPADIEPDALAAIEVDTSGDDIDRLLASLPLERREVLQLRFVDGMSLEEISRALEIPIGTIKSRLHKAIAVLREDPATKKFFEA